MKLINTIKILIENELYSPAGKEVIPNDVVIHKSNPMFRDDILRDGLRTKTGECYKIYVGYGYKCQPAIFATNSTNKRAWFDSTYDDDIWVIDTEIAGVQWYKDAHFEGGDYKHIVTFDDIPVEAIKLVSKGTGQDTWNHHDDETEIRINEDKYRLLRRESDMKHRIDNQLMMAKLQNDLHYVSLDHLILHIADNVAIEIANDSNLDTDEYVTFRNQIKQYIRNNFYEHIKEFWETNRR